MKKSLQEAFAAFSRNERWGTCVACPRDTNGVPYPEFCAYTDRYDHQLTGESLIETYHNYKGDKKPPASAPQAPQAHCLQCDGKASSTASVGVVEGKLMTGKFIKQQVTSDTIKRALIRGDHYDHSLKWILEMVEEAGRDCPGLMVEDVVVVKYGGDRIKGIMGIEFSIDVPLDGYQTIAEVPITF